MEIFLCISKPNDFGLNFQKTIVDDHATWHNITSSSVMLCTTVVLILFFVDVSLMTRLKKS
jgi:hypothetical protein